jgi:opacity protein-like surface antigen
MKKVITTMAALSLIVSSQGSPVSAQERWGMEFRANGAIATQDADRDTRKNGVGFEANVQYRFLPHLGAYVGWDWTHFSALESIAGPNMDLEETGYAFGLRFQHPLREGSGTRWWVRGGGIYNHLELENGDGDIVEDSGHGLGWEAGAGLALAISEGWTLTPGIRYRELSRDLKIQDAIIPVDVEALAFELGVGFTF